MESTAFYHLVYTKKKKIFMCPFWQSKQARGHFSTSDLTDCISASTRLAKQNHIEIPSLCFPQNDDDVVHWDVGIKIDDTT